MCEKEWQQKPISAEKGRFYVKSVFPHRLATK